MTIPNKEYIIFSLCSLPHHIHSLYSMPSLNSVHQGWITCCEIRKSPFIHGSSRNRGSKVVWSVIRLVYSEIGWGGGPWGAGLGGVVRLWLLVMPLKCSRCRLHSAIPSILCLFIECKYDPLRPCLLTPTSGGTKQLLTPTSVPSFLPTYVTVYDL